MREFKLRNGLSVQLLKGDITEVEADAIVNAANSYLQHGGGVALAIVRKGGYEIQRESDEYVRRHGPVPVGDVAVTSAGRLKAKYVIHAVGPRYGVEGEEKLESAVRRSLEKAEELGLKSIALPAISTGIYGYPYEICARLTAKVLKEFKSSSLRLVKVVLYGDEAYKVFQEVFEREMTSFLSTEGDAINR
ncbi:MAG: ADP-ribose-binding protein [Candidatus Aramenus sulfurataquae]|jgi:O-acetyl-ADP-ribose deacetylase (regulator of RNase III)|uniref:ADP-ribose-binding protein n=3 Tax=Candidatus Aramenus sulfurataquae TaxID=1326980 RepID=A0AAE3FNM1_9CREN|nr:ADP-ribose-binding protein [Candidatus Aramenus sulfurataquae]